jgi:hypothetical protein
MNSIKNNKITSQKHNPHLKTQNFTYVNSMKCNQFRKMKQKSKTAENSLKTFVL